MMALVTLDPVDEDASLMQRFAAGDSAAVREMYRLYGAQIFNLARRMLGDHHLAEEAAQQTFVQAFRAADRFDAGRGAVSAWLYQICRRVSIDVYRKEKRHRGTLPLDGAGDSALLVLPASIETAWVKWQIDGAVAALPQHQREVVELCSLGGHTHVEAAAKLGVPVGTVKSRLFKAYRALGNALREVVEEPDAV
jgi:RNA polymerase sigma-70 factor (ECF subfamily)